MDIKILREFMSDYEEAGLEPSIQGFYYWLTQFYPEQAKNVKIN